MSDQRITTDYSPEELMGEAIVWLADARQAGERIDLEEWFGRYPATCHEAMRAHLADIGNDSLLGAVSGRDTTRLASCDKYEIIVDKAHPDGKIGYGGVGAVFQARDRRLNRLLAIKVIRDIHRRNGRIAARFTTEAQVASQLQHPNIVPIYEVSELKDGRPYFTMQLVHGRTMASLLEDHADSAGRMRMLDTIETVCRTVAYAHTRGVLHRDLKPENIMVGAFGQVQVMDWGLASVLQDDAMGQAGGDAPAVDPLETTRLEATLDGQIIGTPAYMPMEQARGERADCRADVFCLGGILGEMLTGRPPFTAATLGDEPRRRKELAETRARIEGCAAGPKVADREIIDLALSCLEEAQERRPANGLAVVEQLRLYHEAAKARVKRVEADAEQARLDKATFEEKLAGARRTFRARMALAVAVFCMVAGWGMWMYARQQRDAERHAKELSLLEAERSKLQIRFGRSLTMHTAGKEQEARKLAYQVIGDINDFSERFPDDDAGLDLLGNANVAYAIMIESPYSIKSQGGDFFHRTKLLLTRPDEKSRTALEEQLGYFDRGATILQASADRSPETGSERRAEYGPNHIGRIRIQCGQVLTMLRRYTEALEQFDLGISNETDQALKSNYVKARAGILLWAEGEQRYLPWSRPPHVDHAKAMRLSAYLAASKGVSSAAVFNVACTFALASEEAGISPEEKERRGAQAVAFLRRIKDEGYFRSAKQLNELREDTDLPPVRRRADFQAVQRSAEGK